MYTCNNYYNPVLKTFQRKKKKNKINVKNKPAHNRTKHDATARYDDDDIDDIVIMLQFNLIKDDDIANIFNYII